MIKRTKYLQKIIPFIDKPLIKVIIGVRRSGKTVLLSQVREHIQAAGINNERIVDINFESFANRKYQTADALYEHVLQKQSRIREKALLVFDEIQEVSDWQKSSIRSRLILTATFTLPAQTQICFPVNSPLILPDDMFTSPFILSLFPNIWN